MAQLLNVIAYILGAIGTSLLFFFSYTAVPSGASFYSGRGSSTHFDAVRAKNKRWTILQRIGFALLTLSFILQIVAAFVPADWGT